MINIRKKEHCSGCYACVNICPRKCIAIKIDDEGFWYPSVDLSQCVKCGLCKRVCHHCNRIDNDNQPEAYACYSTDETVRMQSSSGGIFTCIAQEILNSGGAVFGAAFDDSLKVKHICVTQPVDLDRLRGSKYVQSCIGDSYAVAKQMLQNGQRVFFTGTPCQIGGLKLYLGREYDNLYTADVVCHGAPSPKVWEIYIGYLEEKYNSRINKSIPPFFRYKTPGKPGYSLHINFDSGAEYCMPFWEDSYLCAFVNDLTLRPSCYRCEFKGLHRNSDITMADFWGVDQLMPEMYDLKGTSLLLLNSDKGKQLFESVRSEIEHKPISVYEAVRFNPSAYRSAVRPFKRRSFIVNVTRENFTRLYQKCVKKSFFELVYHKGKRFFDLLLKNAKAN